MQEVCWNKVRLGLAGNAREREPRTSMTVRFKTVPPTVLYWIVQIRCPMVGPRLEARRLERRVP